MFVSVWAILFPLPEVAPVTPDPETVHEKVVPETVLVRSISVISPVQMSADEGVTVNTGMGFTVTCAVVCDVQVPAVAVAV